MPTENTACDVMNGRKHSRRMQMRRFPGAGTTSRRFYRVRFRRCGPRELEQRRRSGPGTARGDRLFGFPARVRGGFLERSAKFGRGGMGEGADPVAACVIGKWDRFNGTGMDLGGRTSTRAGTLLPESRSRTKSESRSGPFSRPTAQIVFDAIRAALEDRPAVRSVATLPSSASPPTAKLFLFCLADSGEL